MMGRRLISWRELMYRGPLLPHPLSKTWSHAVLALLSEGYPPPRGRLPTCYSPVRRFTGVAPFSLDLHVLGAPLTFVLSQDQTLQLNPDGRWPAKDHPTRSCFEEHDMLRLRCEHLAMTDRTSGTHVMSGTSRKMSLRRHTIQFSRTERGTLLHVSQARCFVAHLSVCVFSSAGG